MTRQAGGVVEPPREPREIEAAFVGGLLLNRALVPEARRIVAPGDIFAVSLGIVYRAILDLADAGEEPDVLSVTRRLRLDAVTIASADPGAFVSALTNGVPRSELAIGYGRMIAATARKRRAMATAAAVVEAIHEGDGESTICDLLDAVRRDVRAGGAADPPRPLAEIPATPTEYTVRDLLPRVGLALIYAPAGVGKTYVALTLETEMLAKWGRPRGLFRHPELTILSPWTAALHVSTEETGGALRARWDRVLAGLHLSTADMSGPLLFRWASDPRGIVALDRIEDVLDEAPGVDAVFCDSVTAMLPTTYEDRQPEWDADNIAVRHLCARLRALAVERGLLIALVHHAGKDENRGARGPSEWRNSVDTVIALRSVPGSTSDFSFRVEKQKDARAIQGFTLRREFDAGAVTIRYVGTEPDTATLTDTARRADTYIREHGPSSQREIMEGATLSRSSVQRAAAACVAAGLWRDTGNRADGSPVYAPLEAPSKAIDAGADAQPRVRHEGASALQRDDAPEAPAVERGPGAP